MSDMHQNSLAAHASEEPKFSAREVMIIDWLEDHYRATDRQVMHGLGFADMNSVRPRITGLVERGELVEVGEVVCPVTKKTVRVVDLRSRAKAQPGLFS